MKENSIKNERSSIEEAIERLEYIDRTYSYNNYYSIWDLKCIEMLLSDYKRVLEMNKILVKENEKLKKDYYNVINKIEDKIDRFDYKFEKAKRQNNKDKSDCYWNLIINFKELLESEE